MSLLVIYPPFLCRPPHPHPHLFHLNTQSTSLQSTTVLATRPAPGTITPLYKNTYITSKKKTCSESKNPEQREKNQNQTNKKTTHRKALLAAQPTPRLVTFLSAGDLTFPDVSLQWGTPMGALGQGCSHCHLVRPSLSVIY